MVKGTKRKCNRHSVPGLLGREKEGRPRDPKAWNGLGSALCRLGRHREAREAFLQAAACAQEEEGRAMYLRNAASTCLDLARPDEAEELLAQTAALDEDHPFLHLRYAQLHLHRGATRRAPTEVEAAIRRCRQVLEKEARLAEAHFTLGLALLHRGDLREAEQAYADGLAAARGREELADACEALEQALACASLPGGEAILARLQERRDEEMARWRNYLPNCPPPCAD